MDDDITAEAAHRKIAANMIDRLKDRLPGHTPSQRRALLRQAASEIRHRCFAHSPPIETDAVGKPKPPSSGEQVFDNVSDVIFEQLAAILSTEAP